ncbi:DUF397 domain-containing protein [Streptosporangium vulgare]|uniref:DUF397 domain-containing protein n=1 Tax=Streptosporangium vulgare TaxID=46190 RepID=A0ABV5T916_9ACTN
MPQHHLANATWRKSSRSQGTTDNCVEVAHNMPGIVAVRDSKDADGPALIFSPDGWRAFVGGVKGGGFDGLG